MSTPRPTDIHVVEVAYQYEDFSFRTPIKFGGVAIDRATIVNVECVVQTETGNWAKGFGSMPLGNVWSFPTRQLSYDATLAVMKELVDRFGQITGACKERGHPIDLTWALEPAYLEAAAEATQRLQLPEPIPPLCTLVAASAFDAALHDGFGKVHSLNAYYTYGPEFLAHDLGHYLGREFNGEELHRYVRRDPAPRLPLYHLVGALDPLTPAEVKQPIGDGLPETLGEWIDYNGLTHLKIKLNGDDLAWDVERVVGVDRIANETPQRAAALSPGAHAHGSPSQADRFHYSLDFNERCPNVGYLLEFLARLKTRAPHGLRRIQYIEQPTSRNLKADRANTMHEASKVIPVVIDESLLDLESLQLAREMGYTGAALKACKGQSQSLLLAAAAQKYGMFLCVQDLSCPGASLLHSAGLAAHVPGVAAIEANSRQYMPAANKPWESRFPGIFHITDGTMQTGVLTGRGLGVVD